VISSSRFPISRLAYSSGPASTSMVRLWLESTSMAQADLSMTFSLAVFWVGAWAEASGYQRRTPSTWMAATPSSGATLPRACAWATWRTSGKKLASASSVEHPPSSKRERRNSWNVLMVSSPPPGLWRQSCGPLIRASQAASCASSIPWRPIAGNVHPIPDRGRSARQRPTALPPVHDPL
jgi:hypothetical protein